MSAIQQTDDLFFNRQDLDRKRIEGVVADALKGTDDGELFWGNDRLEQALAWRG